MTIVMGSDFHNASHVTAEFGAGERAASPPVAERSGDPVVMTVPLLGQQAGTAVRSRGPTSCFGVA